MSLSLMSVMLHLCFVFSFKPWVLPLSPHLVVYESGYVLLHGQIVLFIPLTDICNLVGAHRLVSGWWEHVDRLVKACLGEQILHRTTSSILHV